MLKIVFGHNFSKTRHIVEILSSDSLVSFFKVIKISARLRICGIHFWGRKWQCLDLTSVNLAIFNSNCFFNIPLHVPIIRTMEIIARIKNFEGEGWESPWKSSISTTRKIKNFEINCSWTYCKWLHALNLSGLRAVSTHTFCLFVFRLNVFFW